MNACIMIPFKPCKFMAAAQKWIMRNFCSDICVTMVKFVVTLQQLPQCVDYKFK